jgi:puromycin-sensitive aminopeptidase
MIMAAVTRLLDQLIPDAYHLSLDVDMTGFRFTAEETIEFTVRQATTELVFHGVELEVSNAQLDTKIPAASIDYSTEDQTVTLRFAQTITSGRHELKLTVAGQINDSLHGFYRSSYQHNGQEHWLATTQLEAIHAREAFICIDEPAAKAVFNISLTVPQELTAISNAAIVREHKLEHGRKRVEFAPTPRMSTYLVAYLVGEFEYIEGKTPEDITVRIYATPGKKHQLDFALETAIRTLSYYTDYFGIAYPLSKLDMIAVPDFAAGAMENWGAVTYRETALLFDPAKTSLAGKQRVAEVIAHELAHQWFGNLVTMTWWNDLWLNEGFASWVEVLAQDHLFPEWEVWTQFVGDHFARAQELDALANTHPIEVQVDDPRALDEIFDAVSYSKGGAIINMLHHYLGAETFRRGLQAYLKQYSYHNATTADLWAALGQASGQPVAQVMSAWTSQPGYPLLEIENQAISQRRFYASPHEAAQAKSQEIWPVPFEAVIPGGHEGEKTLVTEAKQALPLSYMGLDWFKPNPGQTGFYRVHYTAQLLENLQAPLAAGQLSPTDRVGLVSDQIATTEAGITSSTTALTLLQTLRSEPHFVVWGELSGGLTKIIGITEDEAVRQRLERFGRWLVQPNLTRLGWDAKRDEPVFDTLMRPAILQQAIRFDDPAVTAEARRRFAAYHAGEPTHPDLLGSLCYAMARSGTAADYELLLEHYRTESVPQLKNIFLATLGRFRDPELIARTLRMSLQVEEVRPQDTILVLAVLMRNHDARIQAWSFIQEQWPTLLERYGAGGHMLEYIPSLIGIAFATPDKAKEVQDFFAAHPHPSITRPVAQAIEAITLKADWYTRDQAQIEQFLTKFETESSQKA